MITMVDRGLISTLVSSFVHHSIFISSQLRFAVCLLSVPVPNQLFGETAVVGVSSADDAGHVASSLIVARPANKASE